MKKHFKRGWGKNKERAKPYERFALGGELPPTFLK
jgi:hypothetical protein